MLVSILFAILLVVHGLIHLMGAEKVFRLAGAPQLKQDIARPFGILRLLAAAFLLATAVTLFTWPRWWWAIGVGAIAFSQIVIATSWRDAKHGSTVNAIVLVGVVFGLL
jgi:hypothetical protein